MNRHLQLKWTVLVVSTKGIKTDKLVDAADALLPALISLTMPNGLYWMDYTGNNAVTYYIVASTNTLSFTIDLIKCKFGQNT